MRTQKISARNFGLMLGVAALNSLFVLGFSPVEQDIWIAVLIACVAAVPMLFLYAAIAGLNPGQGLFEILPAVLGRIAGAALTVLCSAYALFLAAMVTRNITGFFFAVSLRNTPEPVLVVVMMAVSVYLADAGVEVIGRWSAIAGALLAGILLALLLLSVPTMRLSNLKPILQFSLQEILSVTVSLGAIAFGELMLGLAFAGELKSGQSPYRGYGLAALYGAGLFMATIIRNVLTLGSALSSNATYPSYVAVRIINLQGLTEHIENVVSFNMILLGVTKAAMMLWVCGSGVEHLFRMKRRKRWVTPAVGAVSALICIFSFDSLQGLFAFVAPYGFYVLPLTVGLPALLWVGSMWRRTKRARRVRATPDA